MLKIIVKTIERVSFYLNAWLSYLYIYLHLQYFILCTTYLNDLCTSSSGATNTAFLPGMETASSRCPIIHLHYNPAHTHRRTPAPTGVSLSVIKHHVSVIAVFVFVILSFMFPVAQQMKSSQAELKLGMKLGSE